MPHILLTGAGFSRNWGGWLADEAFEYLLGCRQCWEDDYIRALLWKHKEYGGGFEAALGQLQEEYEQRQDGVSERRLAALNSAISDMFSAMNEGFASLAYSPLQISDPESVGGFLIRFDAMFTLNQDLLLEKHYVADKATARFRPKGWQIAGVMPTKPRFNSPIREVTEWGPMPSPFSLMTDGQPYFKLHGSVNWLDRSTRKPMLVIGGDKTAAIGRYDVLGWIHEQFKAYLARSETRLMVIGYSFGDKHINDAIGEAVDRGNLRLFIIDPRGVDVLVREQEPDDKPFWGKPTTSEQLEKALGQLYKRFKTHLIGASRRTLREIFGDDLVEHGKVMRFFD